MNRKKKCPKCKKYSLWIDYIECPQCGGCEIYRCENNGCWAEFEIDVKNDKVGDEI